MSDAVPVFFEVSDAVPVFFEVSVAVPVFFELSDAVPVFFELSDAVPVFFEVSDAVPVFKNSPWLVDLNQKLVALVVQIYSVRIRVTNVNTMLNEWLNS